MPELSEASDASESEEDMQHYIRANQHSMLRRLLTIMRIIIKKGIRWNFICSARLNDGNTFPVPLFGS